MTTLTSLASHLLAAASLLAITLTPAASPAGPETAYDFSFETLMGGDPMPLSAYRGKVMLVVNTASHCGFTPQYEGLEKLYNAYKDKGLVIVGVPSNDFGAQEPGNNAEIANFCKINFGVSFPMASKESVSGDKAHPFYRWARERLGGISVPRWNFHKYLVNRKGELVDYFASMTEPDSPKLISAVERALADKT